MELLVLLLVFVGLPLLGWWLIRKTRSLDLLAKVASENDVDFGFLTFGKKTNAFLLFSDIRFVLWLIGRKYKDIDAPPAVTRALDEARRDYIQINAVMGLIVLAALGYTLSVWSGQ